MLIQTQKIITKISNDEQINLENYMESLNYISNLYLFIQELKRVVSLKDITFLPSFYGKYTSEKLGKITSEKENEMKIIKIQLKSDLEDKEKLVDKIKFHMIDICEEIIEGGNNDDVILTFRLE